MAVNTIRIEDSVKQETTEIAARLGLTFNAVVNILLRKFNETRGFPFEVRLSSNASPQVFDMSTEEFDALCKDAVHNREPVPSMEYTTMMDDSGNIYKQYADGRVEYVLL